MIRKLFCIGFHKTATTSLQQALEMLGLRCLSFNAALMSRYGVGDIEGIFNVIPQFDAFRDWPWPLLYRRLDERVPDAGFLLTVRESEDWLASLKRHSDRTGPTEARRIVYGADMPHGNEQRYLEVYNRHNESIRAYFARRPNFLMLRIEDGLSFEPLCRFLGRPIPKQPFPYLYRTM